MKKRIQKWKCLVCGHIEEASERPLKCADCGSSGYKLKAIHYGLKKQSHADEPEAYD